MYRQSNDSAISASDCEQLARVMHTSVAWPISRASLIKLIEDCRRHIFHSEYGAGNSPWLSFGANWFEYVDWSAVANRSRLSIAWLIPLFWMHADAIAEIYELADSIGATEEFGGSPDDRICPICSEVKLPGAYKFVWSCYDQPNCRSHAVCLPCAVELMTLWGEKEYERSHSEFPTNNCCLWCKSPVERGVQECEWQLAAHLFNVRGNQTEVPAATTRKLMPNRNTQENHFFPAPPRYPIGDVETLARSAKRPRPEETWVNKYPQLPLQPRVAPLQLKDRDDDGDDDDVIILPTRP